MKAGRNGANFGLIWMMLVLQAVYVCDAAARRHVEAIVSAARVTYAVPICVHVKVVAKTMMESNYSNDGE